MQRIVIGTAGHVDHGKTSLIEALTGIDCDRWEEEKTRGITIDLGFAHLDIEAEGPQEALQIGFVDVPGHQRFLNNALAGLGGIRVVLLVVAADQGVEQQTREHLEICRLLEIPQAIVALSKSDLVDSDLLELAELEIGELMSDHGFDQAAIFPTSTKTGAGIPELKAQLVALARQHALESDSRLPFRLPIDRAFQLQGLAAVVTGTAINGEIEPGEAVEIVSRTPRSARVRSIEVHGRSPDKGRAGERIALQLTGTDLADLDRGLQVCTPGIYQTTTRLCAEVTLLPSAPKDLSGSTPIRFHLYSHEVVGRLRPLRAPLERGSRGPVEIHLEAPVSAIRGDRFILRRPSPPLTLGGGRVLDPMWIKRRPAELDATLTDLAQLERAVVLWIADAGPAGCSSERIGVRLGRDREAVDRILEKLADDQRLVSVTRGQERRWIEPRIVKQILDRAKQVIDAYFESDRLAAGMPKAELLARLLPKSAANLGDTYLSWLTAAKVVVVKGDVVNIPGRRAQLSSEESDLSARMLAELERNDLTPPSPAEMARTVGAKPQIFDGVLRYLLQHRQAIRLPGGLIISAKAFDRLSSALSETGWTSFSVAQFKDHFGLSRKWAIPLLEHLDSANRTRRIGELRQIIDR